MKYLPMILIIFIFFTGCTKKPKVLLMQMPKTYLKKSSFEQMPNFNDDSFLDVLKVFNHNCTTKKAQKIYKNLCYKASKIKNKREAREFFLLNFTPYTIYDEDFNKIGLLTGYYEAELYGSLVKTDRYKYPVYTPPSDLIEVDLSSIYPELKNFRLRGKLKGNKVVPYNERKYCNGENCKIICYVDSKIDLFFLEIQGSGRIKLTNGKTIYVGYANQNGHKYSSIGKYMLKKGYLKPDNISMQSIRTFLKNNPSKVDEILNQNRSVIFFKRKNKPSTGSLGVTLTPKRSVAVDPKYIQLGSLLYIDSKIDNSRFSRFVFAQDTGSAIQGALRTDLFLGYGNKAMNVAGRLKSDLKLWMLVPKESR